MRPNSRKVLNRVIEKLNCTVLYRNPCKAEPELLCSQRTGNAGKSVIGVAPDQPHGADHQYQDNSEHDSVFRNVLSSLVRAKCLQKLNHTSSGPDDEKLRAKCVSNNDDSQVDCQSARKSFFHRNVHRQLQRKPASHTGFASWQRPHFEPAVQVILALSQ